VTKRTALIAGITAASFAAIPVSSFAEDAPAAAPAAAGSPLAKLLDASGIAVTSYVDLAYSHASKNIETGSSDRVFDSQNDSITLHQAALQIAKQPKEGFGGLVNFTAGKDVPVFASYPYANGSSQFDVTQAYGQYAKGAMTVIAGKFTTLQGTEVIWAPSNSNYSRSILFGAIPFTHTGVRTTYVVSDAVSVIGGVNNGWDQLSDANRTKTLEFGLVYTPSKAVTVTASDYVGKESAAVYGAPSSSATQGERNSFNLVVAYTVSDPLSLGFEYLNVSQGNFTSMVDGSTIKAKYEGYAGYLTYLFTPEYKLALRAESLNDKDGFHFGTVATKYSEFTATFSYLASDNFELRGEVRADKSTNPYFASMNSTAMTGKSLVTYGIEGLFKF